MKKLFRAAVAITVAAMLFVFVGKAQSLPTGTTGTTLLAGTVVLVLFVMKVGPFEVKDGGTAAKNTEHVQLSDDEAAKLAEVYLRESGPELTEALASGNGALVNDWAKALKLPAGDEARLGTVLHGHHDELMQLASLNELNPGRAAKFFERVAALIHADPILESDLRAQSL